jgi:Listeria/Bacterioides repeat
VSYDGNGSTSGTVPADANKYAQNATVTVLDNTGSLAKSGYAFSGWNTAKDGSGTSYTAGATFAMGTADVVLYATWSKVPTYTVTYNANGATGGSVPVDSTAYSSGATVKVPGNTGSLTRSGYSFAGWNTKADGSGTSYLAGATFSIANAGMILYAQWSIIPIYTVTYNANGATGGSVPVDSTAYQSDTTIKILGNTGSLTRAGYSFTGWNTKADGSGTSYNAGATFFIANADLTLYAQWIKAYSVTYDANGATGGSVPVDSVAYQNGTTVKVLGNTGSLTRTGYSFSGWNTTADGSGTSYSAEGSFRMGTANVGLYAQWSNSNAGTITINTPQQYTVTINGKTTIYVGFASTFTSSYTGSPVSYQWFLNGNLIPGATASALNYTQAASTAYYGLNQLMLEVTDANGIVYSGTLQITVRY